MKKILFFAVLLLEMQCLGNGYARLVSIAYDSNATKAAGQVPFSVTIQSSDKDGQVTLKKDNTHPNIQNVVFNLNDLAAFSFTIPWAGWDGDATIHIKVMKGNDVVAQMDLQDKDGKVKVFGIKNAQTEDISKQRRRIMFEECIKNQACHVTKDIDCTLNIFLSVDPATGYISIYKSLAVECDDPNEEHRIHEQ